ncbi:MAG: hypothetical protein Q9161_007984 [Pseudevernia consocians]
MSWLDPFGSPAAQALQTDDPSSSVATEASWNFDETDDGDTPRPQDSSANIQNGETVTQKNTEHIRRILAVRGNHPNMKADKPFAAHADDGLGDLPGEPGFTFTQLPAKKKGSPIPANNQRLVVFFSRKVGSNKPYVIRWRFPGGSETNK